MLGHCKELVKVRLSLDGSYVLLYVFAIFTFHISHMMCIVIKALTCVHVCVKMLFFSFVATNVRV